MEFQEEIIDWYHSNKRDLPWRHTKDAYTIWLSEVIMQQTRVDQGMPYFNRFREKYPTINTFAKATEEEILKLWQGLGYYSRARNMREAARQVMEEYGGLFPSTFIELRKLKGVGDYTAAAIASFSSNEAVAVVDGNVYRLLARYFAVELPINSTKGKKVFEELASSLLPLDESGIYNQAIMEFGSLVCRPQSPHCGVCRLAVSCKAYVLEKVKTLPVKLPKKRPRERYFNYFVIRNETSLYIYKRENTDIWKGLFDFPMIESAQPVDEAELLAHPLLRSWVGGENIIIEGLAKQYRHVLSHQVLHARFLTIRIEAAYAYALPTYFTKVEEEAINSYAMPRLSAKYIEEEF